MLSNMNNRNAIKIGSNKESTCIVNVLLHRADMYVDKCLFFDGHFNLLHLSLTVGTYTIIFLL